MCCLLNCWVTGCFVVLAAVMKKLRTVRIDIHWGKKRKREKERDDRVAASFVSISGTTSIADNEFPLSLSSRSHFFHNTTIH